MGEWRAFYEDLTPREYYRECIQTRHNDPEGDTLAWFCRNEYLETDTVA